MNGLALIISNDHDELARLSSSLAGIGFSTNCVDNAGVAEQLVSSYSTDYDAVVIDVNAISRSHEHIIGALRLRNPSARIFATSSTPPTFWIEDRGVVVCHCDDVVTHLAS